MNNPQTFHKKNVETLDYPVSKLFNRYGRVRSAIYSRMSDLSIETFKKDGRSYIKHTHLKLLDELDDYLSKGGDRTIKKFVRLKNFHQPPELEDTSTNLTPHNEINESLNHYEKENNYLKQTLKESNEKLEGTLKNLSYLEEKISTDVVIIKEIAIILEHKLDKILEFYNIPH